MNTAITLKRFLRPLAGSRAHVRTALLAIILGAGIAKESEAAPAFKAYEGFSPPQGKSEYVDRPLWYFDVVGSSPRKRRAVFSAVYADGRRAARLENRGTVVWSPRGREFSYLTRNRSGDAFWICDLNGRELPVRMKRNERIVRWQIAWSPDSTRAAFALSRPGKPGENSDFFLAITDMSRRRIIARHRIPTELLAGYPAFMVPPDKFRWSPDGRKILMSWGKVIVLDAETGSIQVISDTPAPAEWAPTSNAVYYLGMRSAEIGSRGWSGLFVRKLDEAEPVLLANVADLASMGFTGTALNYGLLNLSPDGFKLAIGGARKTDKSGTLVVYKINQGIHLDLDHPLATYETDIMTALDWEPNGKRLAIVSISIVPRTPLTERPIEVSVRVFPLDGGDAKTVGSFNLNENPGELDTLGFRTLSWSGF